MRLIIIIDDPINARYNPEAMLYWYNRIFNPENKMETNYSIRKKLGEAGFNQDGAGLRQYDAVKTKFVRNDDYVMLVEYADDTSPILLYRDTPQQINADELGVSNVNTQNDGSPEE